MLEILLGNIGGMNGAIHQHMIPGFSLGRARTRDLPVPFIGSLKNRIDIENGAGVVEKPMVNYLSYLEFRLVL